MSRTIRAAFLAASTATALSLTAVGASVATAATRTPSHPAVTSEAGRAAGSPAISLHVKAGDGVALAGKGATARLAVTATAAGRPVPVPGTLRYTSSAPAVISVSASGVVRALAVPGSAVITITSTAPGVSAVKVTVAAVRLTAGTVNLTAAEVRKVSPGRLTLNKDSRTLGLRDGSVVVDAPAGLVARLSRVTSGAATITANTARVPLATAFRELSVNVKDATASAAVMIGGGQAVIRDASGRVVAAAVSFKCSAAKAGVTITPPSANLHVTGQLNAGISISPFNGLSVTLEPGATVSGQVSLGAVHVAAAGSVAVRCALDGLPGISLPLPTGLPPLGTVEVTVDPSFGMSVLVTSGSAATLTAPVITGTWSALAGITYTSRKGWSPVHTQTTSTPTVTATKIAAPGSVAVALKVGPRFDLGLAVSSAGITLAGINLAWAELDGTLNGSLTSPYDDRDPGYTGPRYTAGAEFAVGLEATPQDSALTTLLSWIGLTPPSYTLTLLDKKFPLVSQPVPSVTAAGSQFIPGGPPVTLTAAVGAAWNGATVDFLLFPSGAAPNQPSGIQVAAATVAKGTATGQWSVPKNTLAGSYLLVAELVPAPGFLPFPSAPDAVSVS
jgi:hypothetical protein